MKKGPLTLKLFLLIVTTDLIDSLSDLAMKKGLLDTGISSVTFQNLLFFLSKNALSVFIWAGILLFIVNFFIWIKILSKIELSIAFPVGSTSYVFVPLLAMIFLGEHVTLLRWQGIIFIIGGIYFLSRSSRRLNS